MLIARVIHHEVGDQTDAEAVRVLDELDHVGEVADARVHGEEVRDVVAAVPHGRLVEGQQPEAVDAEPLQVVELLDDALDVAHAVVGRVVEPSDGQLVEDGLLVPVRAIGRCAHVRVLPIDARVPGTRPACVRSRCRNAGGGGPFRGRGRGARAAFGQIDEQGDDFVGIGEPVSGGRVAGADLAADVTLAEVGEHVFVGHVVAGVEHRAARVALAQQVDGPRLARREHEQLDHLVAGFRPEAVAAFDRIVDPREGPLDASGIGVAVVKRHAERLASTRAPGVASARASSSPMSRLSRRWARASRPKFAPVEDSSPWLPMRSMLAAIGASLSRSQSDRPDTTATVVDGREASISSAAIAPGRGRASSGCGTIADSVPSKSLVTTRRGSCANRSTAPLRDAEPKSVMACMDRSPTCRSLRAFWRPARASSPHSRAGALRRSAARRWQPRMSRAPLRSFARRSLLPASTTFCSRLVAPASRSRAKARRASCRGPGSTC